MPQTKLSGRECKVADYIKNWTPSTIYYRGFNRAFQILLFCEMFKISWFSAIIPLGLCTNHVDKWGGRGVAQLSTLLNKSYFVKVSTKVRGVKNVLNSVNVVCTQPLIQSRVSRRVKMIDDFILTSRFPIWQISTTSLESLLQPFSRYKGQF